ncbi:MAG: response regulator transcription factor [Sedimentisphaerales bacterium]|nr:response regulator transcription factor [Sedimentisphaerales bacterium]
MTKVLIIEDNSAMLRGLKDNFESKGYHVSTAQDGQHGLKAALTENLDLVILDIVLPKINGYQICSEVRKKNFDMPIIMLSARDQESDIVMGLNLGADDYVTKPFGIKELMARAEAFMRRRNHDEPEVYEFDNFRLDTVAGTLTRNGREIELSPGQFRMLRFFLKKPGCTLTPDEVRDAVWGYSRFITLQDIDQAVVALRNKIELDPNDPMYIHTVELIGYKFIVPRQNGNDFNS